MGLPRTTDEKARGDSEQPEHDRQAPCTQFLRGDSASIQRELRHQRPDGVQEQ